MITTMELLSLVLLPLAVARFTRLITADYLTEKPRNAAVRWLMGRKENSLLAYLLLCSWCSSVYVGSAVATGWVFWGDERWFAAVMGAAVGSWAAGFLSSKEID